MTENEIKDFVNKEKFVLFDFFATWCMPCKMQSQIIADLKEENINNFLIEKIDVDENPELVKYFGIVSVPTLVLYKDGEIVKKYVGIAKDNEIKSWLV